MKEPRNYIIIILFLLLLFVLMNMRACEKPQVVVDTSAQTQYLHNIAVEQGKNKDLTKKLAQKERSEDSLTAYITKLEEKERNRPRLADFRPTKTIEVHDTGYVPEKDYDDLQKPCVEVQADLDSVLEANRRMRAETDTTRAIQAAKDTSNQNIIASQQAIIQDEKKKNEKAEKKLKWVNLRDKAIVVAAILIVIARAVIGG